MPHLDEPRGSSAPLLVGVEPHEMQRAQLLKPDTADGRRDVQTDQLAIDRVGTWSDGGAYRVEPFGQEFGDGQAPRFYDATRYHVLLKGLQLLGCFASGLSVDDTPLAAQGDSRGPKAIRALVDRAFAVATSSHRSSPTAL